MVTVLLMVVLVGVVAGSVSAFAVCFMRKWQVKGGGTVMEWLGANGGRLVYEWTQCAFCQNFWLSLPLVVVAMVLWGWWLLLAVPVATMTGRLLVG